MRPRRWFAPLPVLCPKCGLDMASMSDDDGASHQRFHAHLAAAPRSIPSQEHRKELSMSDVRTQIRRQAGKDGYC